MFSIHSYIPPHEKTLFFILTPLRRINKVLSFGGLSEKEDSPLLFLFYIDSRYAVNDNIGRFVAYGATGSVLHLNVYLPNPVVRDLERLYLRIVTVEETDDNIG